MERNLVGFRTVGVRVEGGRAGIWTRVLRGRADLAMTAERLRASAARLRELAGDHATRISRTVQELDGLSPSVLGSTDLADAVAAFTAKLHSVARAESRMMETSAENLIASAAAMTGQDRDIAEGLRTLEPHHGEHTPGATSHTGRSHSGNAPGERAGRDGGHRPAHTAHRTTQRTGTGLGSGGNDPARTSRSADHIPHTRPAVPARIASSATRRHSFVCGRPDGLGVGANQAHPTPPAQTGPTGAVREMTNLVDLKEALSYPSSRVRRLLDMTTTWGEAPVMAERLEPRFQPKQQLSLAERIGEAETAKLINQFLSGTTQGELAQRYGASASSVKRLLQARDVRLWSRTSRNRR